MNTTAVLTLPSSVSARRSQPKRSPALHVEPSAAALGYGQGSRLRSGFGVAAVLVHLLLLWAVLQASPVRSRLAEVAPALVVQMLAPTPPAEPVQVQRKPLNEPAALNSAVQPALLAPPSISVVAEVAAAPATVSTPTAAPIAAPLPSPQQSPSSSTTPAAAAAPALKQIPPHALRYLALPRLNYPLLSKRAREAGVVVLRIVVDSQGWLKDAAVHKSSGFERLDQQALQDIRSARFAPQTDEGRPVEWETLAPLAYELDR
ncbi:TonB family protein [Paucibacter sp. APW11]|uniref:TonB family protein n=1 Tax=Roseateles aquae TaxID=3077235 RepID=A0ABU3P879_9BURK|nr:TonB family protein [Paucibacter sp. APW11]MDT8998288.1 TonB family protein [Paucibacter sp. APW11]